jgi:hypothetical protein
MKIAVYYVVRVYKDGLARLDSGPHKSYMDAVDKKNEDHYHNALEYGIIESFIEGDLQ